MNTRYKYLAVKTLGNVGSEEIKLWESFDAPASLRFKVTGLGKPQYTSTRLKAELIFLDAMKEKHSTYGSYLQLRPCTVVYKDKHGKIIGVTENGRITEDEH